MLTSVLIDDEESACTALKTIIDTYFNSQIKVVGIAHSCLEATGLINQYQPDVVFLDISMPKGSGFDLFEFFPEMNLQSWLFQCWTFPHPKHAMAQLPPLVQCVYHRPATLPRKGI